MAVAALVAGAVSAWADDGPDRARIAAQAKRIQGQAVALLAEVGNVPFSAGEPKPDLASVAASGPFRGSAGMGPAVTPVDDEGLESGDLGEQSCWLDFLEAILAGFDRARKRPATLLEVAADDRLAGDWFAVQLGGYGHYPPPPSVATRRTLVCVWLVASGRIDRRDMESAAAFVRGVAQAGTGWPTPMSPEAVHWLAQRLGGGPAGPGVPGNPGRSGGAVRQDRPGGSGRDPLPGAPAGTFAGPPPMPPLWLLGLLSAVALGATWRWRRPGTGDTTRRRVGEATGGSGAGEPTMPRSTVGGAPPGLPPRFTRIERVAGGGMGEIYRAEDSLLGRTVAIKRVGFGDEASPAMVERFHREARALARLDHPGIVRIHDVDLGERPWFVMEWLEGRTLEEWRRGLDKLGAVEVAQLGIELLEALGHAHGQGVVHRDLKPSNVIRLESGALKLVDFGIARLVDTSTFTGEGAVLGTAAYMSPEQIQGKPVDRRSDLWSVGALLYRLLVGRAPFEGIELMARVFRLPDPPSAVDPGVGTALDGILARAMAVRPEQRYPDARAFAEALRRVAEPPVGAAAGDDEGPTSLG